jgi:hypothetical protein
MTPEIVLRYRSGEQIKRGDRVLFHGNPAEIELVAGTLLTRKQPGTSRSSGAGLWFLTRSLPAGHLSRRSRSKLIPTWNSCPGREIQRVPLTNRGFRR